MSKEFIKNAEAKLIQREVVKQEDFSISTVTNAEMEAFEKQFQLKLPDIIKEYLSEACFDFNYIMAPVPVDIDSETIQDNEYECDLCWIDIFSVPKGKPLSDLTNRMLGFREIISEGLVGVTMAEAKNFLVIGDWMGGAGPLCIDLSKPDDKVDRNNEDTWNICWFDHEEFEWDQCYMENGILTGNPVAPDFKTLIEWYFCGTFDKSYEEQCEKYGEELSPRSTWIQYERK